MRRTRLRAFLAVLLASAGASAVGCGAEDDGSPRRDDVPTIVREDVRVLDGSTRGLLRHVSPDELRFAASAASLETFAVGRVLVSEPTEVAPFGFLRRVTALETSGDELIVRTRMARLYEVFQQAAFETDLPLSTEDLLPHAPEGGALSLGVPYNFVVKDLDGNFGTTKDQLRIQGHVALEGTSKLGWEIFDSDKLFDDLNPFDSIDLEMSLGFKLAEQVDLEVVMPSGVSLDGKLELPPSVGPPKVVFIGVVPVVFRTKVVVYMGGSGAGVGKWPSQSFGVHQSLGLSLGAGCSVEDGCDGWGSATKELSAILPTLSGFPSGVDATLEGYAGVRLEVLVYELAGPFVALEPLARLHDQFPGEPAWELSAGIRAHAGFIFDPLGWAWSNKVLDKTWSVAKAENTPPSIHFLLPADQAKVQIAAPVQLRALHWDLEQGPNCCAVQLTSSVDGVLGAPNAAGFLSKTFTTPGLRTITATVTDNKGAKGTAKLTIDVQNTKPDAIIVQPENGSTHYRGVPFMILGAATDANEPAGKLACSKLTWSGAGAGDTLPTNKCGAANDGVQWAIYATNGAKTLTLTASDPQGATDTAAVSFTIDEPPSNIPPNVVVQSPDPNGFEIGAATTTQLPLRFRSYDPEDATATYYWRAYWQCAPGTKTCLHDYAFVNSSLTGQNTLGGIIQEDTWSVFGLLPKPTCGDSYWGYLELFVSSGSGGLGGQHLRGIPFRVTSPTC